MWYHVDDDDDGDHDDDHENDDKKDTFQSFNIQILQCFHIPNQTRRLPGSFYFPWWGLPCKKHLLADFSSSQHLFICCFIIVSSVFNLFSRRCFPTLSATVGLLLRPLSGIVSHKFTIQTDNKSTVLSWSDGFCTKKKFELIQTSNFIYSYHSVTLCYSVTEKWRKVFLSNDQEG